MLLIFFKEWYKDYITLKRKKLLNLHSKAFSSFQIGFHVIYKLTGGNLIF
jgi:hypothetical protein